MNTILWTNIFNDIKYDIEKTRTKIITNANSELINLYYRLGKMINNNWKYGNDFVNKLSIFLKTEFPDMKGFSPRNLRRMHSFYNEYKQMPNWPVVLANLPWTHNYTLIEKVKDIDRRIWYAKRCIENGWSQIILIHQIESNLYQRQIDNNKITNFSKKLPLKQSRLAQKIIKDPYIFDFLTIGDTYLEKELEKAMIDKIKDVLIELGKGFSFVGNQYKISTSHNDYYLDLLFYHLDLRCYIVVELKCTNFKPEYVGQLNFYITAINNTLKKKQDNDTIGLLLCKEKDKLSVEWALKGINNPIGVASYELAKYVSKEVLEKLPTEEELNLHIDLN